VSRTHVVAATSKGYMRVFSTGGVQQHILCLPGTFVSIAAHENLVAIAYHIAPASNGEKMNHIRKCNES
jgi:hypothetical protein